MVFVIFNLFLYLMECLCDRSEEYGKIFFQNSLTTNFDDQTGHDRQRREENALPEVINTLLF